ncbi:hypothetical protein LD35_gp62 [Escherichia phage vB_EcoP_PhAPEC7]|uniref:Uncharacterized protein n=1 Tax=Escherichia phage vB_EcoP_PhAPEC7 TaxID=1391223 RepID=A0A067ZJ59_9CAUD|nr:hypothetical protein LD35_gp62 [Escherichia phage vB_EcoP_PhAPEC7]AHV82699.1 hypothetical protein PhAPEC7_75 [Escherichia phage vB_EcoP_PhAPEC7]
MRSPSYEDNYSELDHTKAGFLKGDIIVTHDWDTFHELSGIMLLENRPGVTILEPQETYSLERSISSLVFFTKLPHSVSIKRSNDSVRMTVTM